MIVDDSLVVRQQLKSVLRGAGFATLEAVDGVDALKQIETEENLNLIVLDLNMPNMNGLEFLEALRKIPAHKSLPVVMLTTEAHPKLLQQAKQLGAIGWIVKPFKAETIIAVATRVGTKAA